MLIIIMLIKLLSIGYVTLEWMLIILMLNKLLSDGHLLCIKSCRSTYKKLITRVLDGRNPGQPTNAKLIYIIDKYKNNTNKNVHNSLLSLLIHI